MIFSGGCGYDLFGSFDVGMIFFCIGLRCGYDLFGSFDVGCWGFVVSGCWGFVWILAYVPETERSEKEKNCQLWLIFVDCWIRTHSREGR